MSCCETKMTMAKGVEIVADRIGGDNNPTGQIAAELTVTGQSLGDGYVRYVLSVPSMRCGGCVRATESALAANPEVVSARANLTRKDHRGYGHFRCLGTIHIGRTFCRWICSGTA